MFYAICKPPLRLWRLLLLCLLFAHPALAEDADLALSGQLNIAGKYSNLSPTDLVAAPAASGYDDRFLQAVGIVNARLNYQRLRAHSQLRLELLEGKTKASIDEAYGEFFLGEAAFFYAGRRILSYGQSYGLNPVDFLRDPVAENTIYPSFQSRSMSKGADLIGMDIVFDFGSTLSLMYISGHDNPRLNSKENISMVRYSGFLNESTLDYSASLMSGKRPGAGLSLSKAIGDSSVFYLDTTLRQGREKQTILGTMSSGQLRVGARKTRGLYPFFTLGLGHTYANNISINFEASHDAGGYSAQEWRQVMGALDALSPAQSAIEGSSLGQLNGVLNHYTLRKNYTFLRVANDNIFDSSISAELTSIYGVDDGSGNIGVRLETSLGERTTAGISSAYRFGGTNDEFRLRPERSSIALYIALAF